MLSDSEPPLSPEAAVAELATAIRRAVESALHHVAASAAGAGTVFDAPNPSRPDTRILLCSLPGGFTSRSPVAPFVDRAHLLIGELDHERPQDPLVAPLSSALSVRPDAEPHWVYQVPRPLSLASIGPMAQDDEDEVVDGKPAKSKGADQSLQAPTPTPSEASGDPTPGNSHRAPWCMRGLPFHEAAAVLALMQQEHQMRPLTPRPIPVLVARQAPEPEPRSVQWQGMMLGLDSCPAAMELVPRPHAIRRGEPLLGSGMKAAAPLQFGDLMQRARDGEIGEAAIATRHVVYGTSSASSVLTWAPPSSTSSANSAAHGQLQPALTVLSAWHLTFKDLVRVFVDRGESPAGPSAGWTAILPSGVQPRASVHIACDPAQVHATQHVRIELAQCLRWKRAADAAADAPEDGGPGSAGGPPAWWPSVAGGCGTSAAEGDKSEDGPPRKRAKPSPLVDRVQEFLKQARDPKAWAAATAALAAGGRSLDDGDDFIMNGIGGASGEPSGASASRTVITPRADMDFTEHLWAFVQTAETPEDLVDALTAVVEDLETGATRPQVHRGNPTALAAVCRECLRLSGLQSHSRDYEGARLAIAASFDYFLSNPLEWLAELGMWKLGRDLAAVAARFAPLPPAAVYDPAADPADQARALRTLLHMVATACFIDSHARDAPPAVFSAVFRHLANLPSSDDGEYDQLLGGGVDADGDAPMDGTSKPVHVEMVQVIAPLPQYSAETSHFLSALLPPHQWLIHFVTGSSSRADKIWALQLDRREDDEHVVLGDGITDEEGLNAEAAAPLTASAVTAAYDVTFGTAECLFA